LVQGKELQVHTEYEDRLAAKPVRTFWRIEKSVSSARNRKSFVDFVASRIQEQTRE
jgi:hypothetical protein